MRVQRLKGGKRKSYVRPQAGPLAIEWYQEDVHVLHNSQLARQRLHSCDQKPTRKMSPPILDGCNQTIISDELKNDAQHSDFESGLKPLWLRAQSGDELSYQKALRLIAGRLRSYFRRHLMNLPDDVEDLVQETLLALHLHRGSYDPTQPVSAWVLGISRHKLMDLYRRRGRREALHEPIDGLEEHLAAEDPGETLANVDLHSLLQELPKAQRIAIEMTKLEGLSVAQASTRTGVSESAIKVQVHRGLKRLAALVRKEPT